MLTVTPIIHQQIISVFRSYFSLQLRGFILFPFKSLIRILFASSCYVNSLKISVPPKEKIISYPSYLMAVGELQFCSFSMCLPSRVRFKAYFLPGSCPSYVEKKSKTELLIVLVASVQTWCTLMLREGRSYTSLRSVKMYTPLRGRKGRIRDK